MTRARTNEVWSIDDLELELRKLPGVSAAGFEEADDVLLVQLHVTEGVEHINRSDRTDQPVPVSASRIAARHSDLPVAVEVVRWRTAAASAPTEILEPEPERAGPTRANLDDASAEREPQSGEAERARLLAVLPFPDSDELEVHLVLAGRRAIGRSAVSAGAPGAVQATLDAVRDLRAGINASVRWARVLEPHEGDGRQVVAVALDGLDARAPVQYGLAGGTTLVDAAARATLDALNRRLTRPR